MDLLFNYLPAAEAYVGYLRSADPDALHPFKILGDSFPGDIASGPVPPHSRPGDIGWVDKAVFQTRSGASDYVEAREDRQCNQGCCCK